MTKNIPFLIIAALIFGLTACDNFFSTTWGIPRKYDSRNIEITVDNLESYKEQSVGNPELARAAGEAIAGKMRQPGVSDTDKAKYMDAAVEFAWIGSELDTFLLGKAGGLTDLLSGDDNSDDSDWEGMLNDFMDSIGPLDENKSFSDSVDNLAVSAGACLDENSTTPQFIPEYKETVDAASVDKAVMILGTGLVSGGNTDDLAAMFVKDNGEIKVKNNNPDPTALALAAYFNLLAEDDDLRKDSVIASSIYDKI